MSEKEGRDPKDKIEHALIDVAFLESCIRLKDAQKAIAQYNTEQGFRSESMVTYPDFHVLRLLTRITSEIGEFFGYWCSATRTDMDLAKELADIVITTLDLADFIGVDVGNTMIIKMQELLARGRRHGKRL